MTKHVAAFRDNYLAAILTIAVLLLIVCAQAQRPYQPYPAPGAWKWIQVDSALAGPAGGATPSFRGGNPRPGGIWVDSVNNNFMFYSGGVWRLVTGSTSGQDTLHQLKFSTPVFDHTYILVGQDPVTGDWLYDDSISLKGPLPTPGQFFGNYNGAVAFHTLNFPVMLDLGGSFARNYFTFGNGYNWFLDSMGLRIRQKTIANGGNDSLQAWYAGSQHLMSLTQTSGLNLSTNLKVGNNLQFNTAVGVLMFGSADLQFALGSKIKAWQQPLWSMRYYTNIGGPEGFNYGNDTTGFSGGNNPDSATYRVINAYFAGNDNILRRKVSLHGDGSIWTSAIRHAAAQDSILVYEGGFFKFRSLAEITAAIGGGGGSGLSGGNRGSGWRWYDPVNQGMKTLTVSPGLLVDSTTTGQLNIKVDSAFYATRLRVMKSIDSIGVIVAGKASTSHTHAAGDIVSGTIATARLDTTGILASKFRVMQVVDSITKARNIPASFTSGSSVTLDYNSRSRFIGTLSHNAVFSVSNMHAGEVTVFVVNGSGGPYTPTFPGGYQPVLKPNTGDTTMVIGSYNGSAWYWNTNVPTPVVRVIITATSGQTSFTPGFSLPTNLAQLDVWRNGVYVQFTTSGSNVILPASTTGDEIIIKKTGN